MHNIFILFLVLHIASGSVGLIAGSFNIIIKKGGNKHKIIGKIFVYSMLASGFSALVLSTIHPNYFLFMVGVFTLYMVGTGNRYLYLKLLKINQKPKIIDWIITITMLLLGLIFIGMGVLFLIKAKLFGLVFITFGVIILLFVKKDFENYSGKSKLLNYWLIAHLQRMIGAYIAALTAFLVVNGNYSPVELPPFLYWLLPSLILTPLIIKWSKKYEIKTN